MTHDSGQQTRFNGLKITGEFSNMCKNARKTITNAQSNSRSEAKNRLSNWIWFCFLTSHSRENCISWCWTMFWRFGYFFANHRRADLISGHLLGILLRWMLCYDVMNWKIILIVPGTHEFWVLFTVSTFCKKAFDLEIWNSLRQYFHLIFISISSEALMNFNKISNCKALHSSLIIHKKKGSRNDENHQRG